jgi:hypothetical protein
MINVKNVNLISRFFSYFLPQKRFLGHDYEMEERQNRQYNLSFLNSELDSFLSSYQVPTDDLPLVIDVLNNWFSNENLVISQIISNFYSIKNDPPIKISDLSWHFEVIEISILITADMSRLPNSMTQKQKEEFCCTFWLSFWVLPLQQQFEKNEQFFLGKLASSLCRLQNGWEFEVVCRE